MAPEPDELPVTSPASNRQPQEGRIQAAIAAPPTLSVGASYGRSEPVGKLSGPAGGLSIDPPGQGSPNFADDSQAGLNKRLAAMQKANGGVDSVTAQFNNPEQNAALRLNDRFVPGGVVPAMTEGNAATARANTTRAGMIDSMIEANGGNGIGLLGVDQNGLTQTDRDNQDKTRRWRQDDLLAQAKGGNQAAGALASSLAQGDTQRDVELSRQGAVREGLALQARGQNLANAAEMARLGLTARGQDLAAKHQDQTGELAAIRTGLDVERFGIEKQAAQRQQAASEALIKATASGDPAAIAQARQAASAAGLKVEPAPNLQHVETDRGQMAFNPQTGKMTPVTAPDGTPIGGAKALTEFQGKATGFGMRADAASQIIEQVGQNGKVQPSLIKRAAEAVPLVGEGLGMAANALQTPEQQQVEQAQRDFVNAVLRQESGAAISQGEFDNARKQYFPQPNDTPEVIAQKAANRAAAINGFRVSAGPGARHIGGAPAQQQPVAAPKVGHIDGKHIYVGGNPADPASWVETR